MARRPLTRPTRLGCEALEPRSVPAVLTVLVPDGVGPDAGSADGMLDLATAVAARTGRPTDVPVATYDPVTGTLTTPDAPPGVLVLDWAGTPNTPEAVVAAGSKLGAYLRTLLPADGRLDIHVVGHGTGASVTLAAVRELATADAQVGRLQVTTLDAHAPAGATLAKLPVPYTVDLADNYYTTTGTPGLRLQGGAVGTEVDLTEALAQWFGRSGDRADHAEVRDWYLWTVDTGNLDDVEYRDPDVVRQRDELANDPAARAALFGQQIDLDADGANDDLAGGAAVGFGQSVHTLFAPRGGEFTGLDLAFVIDTTGSMWDDIGAVKARATEILDTLRAEASDVRVGVVLYRDLADGWHGSPGDYQAQVLVGFTADLDAVAAAIQGIQVGGGADWAESVYSGLTAAVEPGAELGAWRGGLVRKSVLLMGDAPPQLTEPGTGFTKTSTLLRAARAGVDVSAVATTATPDAWHLFQSVAQLTGGDFHFTGPAPGSGGEWMDESGWGGGPFPIYPAILPYPLPIDGALYKGVAMPALAAPAAGGLSGGYAAAAADTVLRAVRDIAGRVRPTGTTPGGDTSDPGDPTGGPTDPGTDRPTVTRSPLDPAAVGGDRTASADFNGDGVADVVEGTGPGGVTRLRVVDGATGQELFAIQPFESTFTGGVNVAVGDVNGDNVADLIVTPDNGGGPRVRVFDGRTFAQVADFLGIDDPNFRGGARATVGDVNGDGAGDLVVAAGLLGGPRVAVFDGSALTADRRKLTADFFAFEPGVRNGVYVAAGDIDGDGKADLVAGGGPGSGPRVTAFSGAELLAGRATAIGDFFAGDTAGRDGARVAVADLDADGRADLVAGSDGRIKAYAAGALAAAAPEAMFDADAAELLEPVYVG